MLLLALCACGSGGTPAPHAGPRRIMLHDVALNVVVPTYEALVTATEAQVAALMALEAQPDATTLDAAQTAWRQARSVWKQSDAFAFGPAATLRSAAKIDWSPIRDDRIERAIAGATSFDSAAIEDLGANVKGLLALEYLLFDANGDDAAALATLSGNGARSRRAYARALAENLRDQSILLRDAWSPSGRELRRRARHRGPGQRGVSDSEGRRRRGGQPAHLPELRRRRRANCRRRSAPHGGAAPRPDRRQPQPQWPGGSLDDVAGIQNVYFGSYGERHRRQPEPHRRRPQPADRYARSSSRCSVCSTRRRDVSMPLEEAVASERADVARVQQRAAELMRHLEIDMVSVLGTTLRFNPGDGD